MIDQQINLYQDQFRDKKTLFSAAQLAMLLVLVITGMAVYSLIIQMELKQAKEVNQDLNARKASIADELNSANAELSKLLADNRMDEQISGVSHEIKARRKVLNFVDANQFGSGQGFSPYLVSLSNLHINDVWLDEIRLSENYVGLLGSALNAELVPEYFDQFGNEAVFVGRRFEVFQLQRDENTDWKVDFEIASRETINE